MQILNFPDGFLTITKLETHFVGSVTFFNMPICSKCRIVSFNGVINACGTLLGGLITGATCSLITILCGSPRRPIPVNKSV